MHSSANCQNLAIHQFTSQPATLFQYLSHHSLGKGKIILRPMLGMTLDSTHVPLNEHHYMKIHTEVWIDRLTKKLVILMLLYSKASSLAIDIFPKKGREILL